MNPKEHIQQIALQCRQENPPRNPTCKDFREVDGFPGCCGSCHTDNEEYDYELCEAEIPIPGGTEDDVIRCQVCCHVSNWIASYFP